MASVSDRIRAPLRYTVYAVFGVLWFSGCLWMVLDQFFARSGQFGVSPHPWEPTVLLIHGVLAIIGTYLLGWISSRHALDAWLRAVRRWSGGSLAVVLALLVVSGFALFFLSEDKWQRFTAFAHETLGLGFTAFAVQHWFFAKRRDIRSAASRPW
jgi:hypothetical protein